MTDKKKYIPLSVPYLKGNELKYVSECIETEWVSSAGGYVEKFEKNMAGYVGSAHSTALCNGTAALHLALIVSNVLPGEEVFAPALTFIAPINTIRYVNAEPVFIDCDEFLNISASSLESFIKKDCVMKSKKLMNKKTGRFISAIIPVHIFGHPADMEKIMDIAKENNLKVIEDATESLGSYYVSGKYKGKKTGTVGDFGCYSFNGNKIITTGGGGMIVSNDIEACEKIKYLSTQAKDDPLYYVHNNVGYNYRMTNVQAALGCAQLEKIDKYIKIKRSNFKLYKEIIDAVDGLDFIEEPEYSFSNYWFYSLLINNKKYGADRDRLLNLLKANGVESRPIWHLNHLQRPYEKCARAPIKVAKFYLDNVLNIPCSVGLGPDDIAKVANIIKKGVEFGK